MTDNKQRISFRIVLRAAPDEVRTGGKGFVGVVAVLTQGVEIKNRKTETVTAEDVIDIAVVMGDHLA